MDIDKLVELGKQGKLDELELERDNMYEEFISTVTDPEQIQNRRDD